MSSPALASAAGLGSLALLVAGCATPAQPVALDLAPIRGQPPGTVGQLYAACLTAATQAQTVEEAHVSDVQLLQFTCRGATAQALDRAMQAWSAKIGSAWEAGGRVWRSTTKVKHDLIGIDYCSTRPDGGDAACVITLNVGEILSGALGG